MPDDEKQKRRKKIKKKGKKEEESGTRDETLRNAGSREMDITS